MWYRIQGQLSRRTRVCAWDPAGLGFSSPSPEPQDAIHETEDLEKSITGSAPGRLVCLGGTLCRGVHRHTICRSMPKGRGRNGFGGPLYPRPGLSSGTCRTEVCSFRKRGADGGSHATAPVRRRACKPCSETRYAAYDECTAPSLLLSAPALTKALAQLNADPARLLTQASAIENVSVSGREVINPQRSYGDMPLIVLTCGSHPMPPQVPADVREQPRYFSRRSRLGITPMLSSPRGVTTKSFRIRGTLSRLTSPRRYSWRSRACWQRSGRNRPINARLVIGTVMV